VHGKIKRPGGGDKQSGERYCHPVKKTENPEGRVGANGTGRGGKKCEKRSFGVKRLQGRGGLDYGKKRELSRRRSKKRGALRRHKETTSTEKKVGGKKKNPL